MHEVFDIGFEFQPFRYGIVVHVSLKGILSVIIAMPYHGMFEFYM